MNKFESDVIVIGAGTAGSVAAFTAAKKGLKTIILERKAKEDIGNKVCGDGVGSRHLEYLPSIGIKLDKSKIVHSYPEEAHIISPDKRNVDSFDCERKFSSWIYRIAHNEAINWATRKNKQTVSIDDLSAQDSSFLASDDFDASMEKWFNLELKEVMREAIKKLPENSPNQ